MANKKRTTRIIQSLTIGDDINRELRELVDLVVRKQLTIQDLVQRFVNTRYFAQKFPGLIKSGDIATDLAAGGQTGISAQNLASAIANYETALVQFKQTSQRYGYGNFTRHQLATALDANTSPEEFAARLKAIDAVDSNPELQAAFKQAAQIKGNKGTKGDMYRFALEAGDRRFQDTYEAAQLSTQLGLKVGESRKLASKALPTDFTPESTDNLVSYVRENLQAVGPELAARGITAPKLVKILANPGAFASEVGVLQEIVAQRKARYQTPVVGSYGRPGAAGGLSLYGDEGQQAYG